MKDWIYVLRVRTGLQSGKFGDNVGRCIVYYAEVAITQQFREAVSTSNKGGSAPKLLHQGVSEGP